MGLKRNIAIPLGFYFVSNVLRSDSSRIINNVSWKKYAYLVQKTLSASFIKKSADFLQKFSLYTSKSHLFTLKLSDFCLNVRKLPYIQKTRGTSAFDLDSSISTYNSKFFNLDYKSRSQFFWIANSNNYLSPEFLLQSFEKPVFKDAAFFDWRSRWLSKFYSRFLKYAHNSWSRAFSKVLFKDTYDFSAKIFKIIKLSLRSNIVSNIKVLIKLYYFKKFSLYLLYYFCQILNIKSYTFSKSNKFLNLLVPLFLKSIFKDSKISSFALFIRFFLVKFSANNLNSDLFLSDYSSFLFTQKKAAFNFVSNKVRLRLYDQTSTLIQNNNLWIYFNRFLNFRNFFLIKWYSLITRSYEGNTRAERYLLWQRYSKKFNYYSNFQFKNSLFLPLKNYYNFFNTGYLRNSKLITINRSYFVPKINVNFFTNTSSRLIVRRIYSWSQRNMIKFVNVNRWYPQIYRCQQNLLHSMFFMRVSSIFAFNDSSSKFLDFNLENFTFKILLFFINCFSNLYLPLMSKSNKLLSPNNLLGRVRKSFSSLSHLSLILYSK